MAAPAFHVGEVLAVVRLSPHVVRVVLGGAARTGFVSSGDPDERIVLYFPAPGQRRCPVPGTSGEEWSWPDGQDAPDGRNYTVRRYDGTLDELAVDFVVHDGGVASTWVQQARPGDSVGVTDAGGWYSPPADACWQLLVGDATALPAIARACEQARPGTRVEVVVEVPDAADVQQLTSPADLEVRWLTGSGHWLGPSRIEQAVREAELPPGPGYVWVAGECSATRAVRKHLLRERGLSKDAVTVIGYWRVAAEQWMQRYQPVQQQMVEQYVELVDSGRTGEDLRAEWDELLERAGF